MCKASRVGSFSSLLQLSEYLKNEKACLKFVEEWRWGGKIRCPWCGDKNVYRYKSRPIFKCGGCSVQFSSKVGTIFENSKVPLKKWIMAIYLLGSNKKGISSHQLGREIEVSQKTAWFMLHRIRKMMAPDLTNKLSGVIMADEAFVGGKNKNRKFHKKTKRSHGRMYRDKTPVVGLLQEGGDVRCFVTHDTTMETLHELVKDNVELGSIFVTDDWGGYNGLKKLYKHEVVEHYMKRYKSEGGFSTNAVEGFWGHLKRTIFGIYHNVMRKHLQRYVDEIAFRYNTRKMGQGERFAVMMANISRRLPYKKLRYG